MAAREWISAPELASLAGIHRRPAAKALARAHAGKPWRDVCLEVCVVDGRGGRSGKRYQVAVDSLPVELQNAWLAARPSAPPARRHDSDGLAEFRREVVLHVRRSEAADMTPVEAIREACATFRYPQGKYGGRKVSPTRAREWCSAYEAEGAASFARKERNDKGKGRVIISRELDALAARHGVSEERLRHFFALLERRIRGEFQRGFKSVRIVRENVRPDLKGWMRAAGVNAPRSELHTACLPPRGLVRRYRHHRVVSDYREDAGIFAGKHKPRIRRNRDSLEIGALAGDVHHFDIWWQREDGTFCTPKAVSWLCLATNRVFITPFVMEKGRGIGRQQVAESFLQLCMDEDWGVPTFLYLDLGSEYVWTELVKDLLELAARTGRDITMKDRSDLDDRKAIQHSRAYNPQSKVIETTFSSLRRVFGQIEGWIGGDRTTKRTQNQGKLPKPYKGAFEDFQATIRESLAYHHALTQQGHLKGATPFQRFGQFVSAGWQSTLADRAEFELVFAAEEPRDVRPGGTFAWKGDLYQLDALFDYLLQKVRVRDPWIVDVPYVYVLDEHGKLLGRALPDKEFDFFDTAGAAEHQRRGKLAVAKVKEMESEGDRKDPRQTMRDVVKEYGPIPHATSHGVITVNPEYAEAARLPAPEIAAIAGRDKALEKYDEDGALMRRLANALAESK